MNKKTKLEWDEEFDDEDNTIWTTPSPYTDECGSPEFYFKIKQRLCSDAIEYYNASDFELMTRNNDLTWDNLEDAQEFFVDEYNSILADCK